MAQPVASHIVAETATEKACPAKGISFASSLVIVLIGCFNAVLFSAATANPFAASSVKGRVPLHNVLIHSKPEPPAYHVCLPC